MEDEFISTCISSYVGGDYQNDPFLRVNKLMLRQIPYKTKGSRKKKGRGQKIGSSPKKWTRTKRKKMRNSGKSYVTNSGKIVPGKKANFHKCKCTRKDCKDLTKEAREISHRDFWAMGDYNDQNA